MVSSESRVITGIALTFSFFLLVTTWAILPIQMAVEGMGWIPV